MDIFSITIFISVLVFVAVGSYQGKSVKKIDDYFVAGRRAPTILIVGTLVASVFSTSIFMGEAAFTYDGQLGAYILFPGIAGAGYVYGALWFGTYLRRSKAPTVAAFFGERFNSRRVQQAAGITIILGLTGYLLVVTQGAAILLSDLTPMGMTLSVVVAWLSYTLFTLYAGSKGVIITDTLMFLLFTAATVVFVWVLMQQLGGVSTAVTDLTLQTDKPGITAWHGIIGEGTYWPTGIDFLIWIIAVDFAWGIVYAVGPWQASRHLMAKDEHVVLRAAIYACFAVMLLQYLIYGIGGFINLLNPNLTPSETVIIWAAKSQVSQLLGATLLAGIVAAALSSASTFLSLVGFSVSNDLSPSDKPLSLRVTRITMAVTSVLALVLSIYAPPNIFWFMLFIGTVFASSWGPVGFMSIFSKRITEAAAFWGMVAGFFANVIPASLEHFGFISLPSYLNPVIIGTLVSLLTIFTVSRMTMVTSEERNYQQALHVTPTEDRCMVKVKRTLIAPVALMVYGCVMPIILLYFYVYPYQLALGVTQLGEGINWMTGEALLPLSTAVLHLTLGGIAAITIYRRYAPMQQSENQLHSAI